jgi:N6-adenosine-specific RNA methylase IME4
MTQLELDLFRDAVTTTSWAPVRELSYDEWLRHGHTIARVQDASMWWLGDWWRYGEHRYGDRARAAELELPWAFQTCMDAGWVASRIGTSRRREVLSWSHHREVAALEPDEQDRWLAAAEQGDDPDDDGEHWTRAELRAELRSRRSLNAPAPPEGRYRCLVIDPPWPVEKIVRDVRPRQGAALDYPTMELEQIAELPVGELAADDGCHVYLWTTHRYAPAAFELLERWGAVYECLLTWVKPTGMTPFSWLYDTEHILFARIGSLPLERLGLPLSIAAPTGGHSVKPDGFYDRVRAASPEPRLEMFARQRRDGFTPWGDEVAA